MDVESPGSPGPGRPTKYREEMIPQVEKLAKLGATDVEISDFFEIDKSTLKRWKGDHPEFFEAMKLGKEAADNRVERALYARAVGYEHDDVDIRVADNIVTMTPIRKIYPPDVTACIFWLKNRRKDLWRAAEKEDAPAGTDLAAILRAVADKLPV